MAGAGPSLCVREGLVTKPRSPLDYRAAAPMLVARIELHTEVNFTMRTVFELYRATRAES